MAKSTSKTAGVALTETIRSLLGHPVPPELLQELEPELFKKLSAGMRCPTGIDLLAKKLVRLALDPKKSNQWAINMIYERLEGKAAQGEPVSDEGRQISERLNELTTAKLNSLAARFASDKRQSALESAEAQEAEKQADRREEGDLDVQRDGDDRPEDAEGQSALETGTEEDGRIGYVDEALSSGGLR